MVAVFGTMCADVLHVEFGVPYIASTIVFALLLVAVFWSWSRTERTLSIHSITTSRREAFYWAAVLTTFAMGTAVGDLAAYTFGLGFLSAGVVFAVLITIPGIAFYAFGANSISPSGSRTSSRARSVPPSPTGPARRATRAGSASGTARPPPSSSP